MKKLLLLFLSGVLIFGVTSCDKDSDIIKQEVSVSDNSGSFITDQGILDLRLVPVNQAVNFQGKSANELNYTWVYNITPMVVGGVTLSAAAVDGYEDAVYVGWHARGNEVYGELSILNISNPDAPTMMQSATYMGQEINDLEIKPNVNKLLIAGQAKSDMSNATVGDNNAMGLGYKTNVNGSVNTSSNYNWENYLPGYSANSVTYVANETIWLSKGSQGGMTVFRDYDLGHIKLDMQLSNAKHFDATGDYGVLLAGVGFNESILKVWDMTNLYNPVAEYTIPYDVTPLGKNGVDVNGHYAYLAMGNDGVVKVDLTDGSVVNNFDYDNGGFCNGIAVDWRYIYAAYGADGLFVIDKETFEVMGNWDFNGSCNYVKKVGDYLFLANGDTDGMIMLKKD